MQTNKKLQVDLYNKNKGYFLARSTEKTKKLKLQIQHQDNMLYYDLNTIGRFEIFPLQFGDGEYIVTLYKQVSGNRYAKAGRVKFSVNMLNENEVYLHYNQYVQEDVELTTIAKKFCVDGNESETFEGIRKYIRDNFAYDYIKALTIRKSMLPDISLCFKNRIGICQDLAALAVSMYRGIGIPSKLVIGYADKKYHAWASVLIDGYWILYDPTVEVGAMKKPKNYSIERWY